MPTIGNAYFTYIILMSAIVSDNCVYTTITATDKGYYIHTTVLYINYGIVYCI